MQQRYGITGIKTDVITYLCKIWEGQRTKSNEKSQFRSVYDLIMAFSVWKRMRKPNQK